MSHDAHQPEAGGVARDELARLVDGAPLVVCLGPGGVGKTTLSAVIALHQAASAQRALVLTVDPARRLADALGLAALGNEPATITSFAKLHPGGSLAALMLDPAATFDRLVAMLVPDSARRSALFANRYYQHLSRSLAGTLEYMAVERLHELVGSGRFDRVVLDTPPTTNALDFLEAPDRLAAFFDEGVTRWFMPTEQAKGRSLAARLVNRAGSSALALLRRVAGDGFVDDTVGFFGAFADLFGSFRSRGVEVGRLLRHPRTVFLVVCAPDGARVAEALAIDRRLAEAGCRAQGFVVNRVDEPFLPSGEDPAEALARATALLGGASERPRVEAFLGRLEALRAAQHSAASQHHAEIDALRRAAAGRPVFTAPRVPASESPRASLLALYVALFPNPAASERQAGRDGDAIAPPVVSAAPAKSPEPAQASPPPATGTSAGMASAGVTGGAIASGDVVPLTPLAPPAPRRGRRVTDADA